MDEQLHYEAKDTVGMVLMGSEEAKVIVDLLHEQRPDLTITDDGCYYSIEGKGKIEIDLDEVSERLGRELDVPSFLVIMSSFYGRVHVEERRFGVYAELLDLDSAALPSQK
ncbi:MAG: MmoB/DmpM family protein [Candidatus Binatia bacterium]|nr:MmoB/DmpM family protein [Candidatus Binatia bacterium]